MDALDPPDHLTQQRSTKLDHRYIRTWANKGADPDINYSTCETTKGQ